MGALGAAPGTETFTGVITDNECGKADHSLMRMGPTDAECAVACSNYHGATYVLYDGKNTYALSDQKTSEKLAARKVTVVGTLDARTKTIAVESMSEASPSAGGR